MSKIYDCGIIGAGVGGAFAAYKIAKDYKDLKTIIFDLGRPPLKRRRQIDGWLGALPNSDGKLYQNDIKAVADLIGNKKALSTHSFFEKTFSNVTNLSLIKDTSPNSLLQKKLSKINYDITLNDYIQIYPKDIHALSKFTSSIIEKAGNVEYSFDNEVFGITVEKNVFHIQTERDIFKCKKIILAVGRSGWRWAKDLYSKLGIIENNDYAKFGIRVEVPAPFMKDFNNSNCSLKKEQLIEISPLSWFGTVIPEDHVDVAISAFRSNEKRWETDKVSFNLIGNIAYPGNGSDQTDRISKLIFILSNDRIVKEKISTIISGKSKISILPEYNWIKDVLIELGCAVPEILTKGSYHVPTIMPLAPKINLGDNLESEIPGMFVVGESAGLHGIVSAACTGLAAVDGICK